VSLVSYRAVRLLVEALEARGGTVSSIAHRLPVPLETLRDRGGYLHWNAFAELLTAIGEVVGGPRGLEELGVAMIRVPSYGFIRAAASYTVSVRQLHELGRRWVAPALLPGLHIALEDIDARTMRINTRIPPHLRGSPEFFHVCRGMVSALSTLLDQPPSIVDASISPYEAEATVLFPSESRGRRSVLRKLRGAIGRMLFEDVVREHDDVHASYQALVRTRQEFREVLERAPTAVAIHRDGRYVWANPAYAAMLGWQRPQDIVGRDVMDDVHPDDVEFVRRHLARSPTDSASGECRLKRRDGSIVNAEIAPTQPIEFESRPARLFIANDVTERVQVRARLALADRMASLGTLAAGVAHEVNNPLTYARLALDALEKDLSRAALPKSTLESLSMASDGVDRVRTIVSDLRTFSRADEESIGSVDLNDVVSTTLRFAANTVTTSSSVELDLTPVPRVRANRARLGQVVLNLLLNAYHAIEERAGSGRIRIRTFRERDGRVGLEIADSGSGIAPATLPHIFEPFFTTKPVGRGTGLGLAICHRIVTAFDGEISVQSAPESADPYAFRTFFRILLPPMARAEAPAEAPPSSDALARRRVLVIDDEPSVGRALERALERHDVETVTNGRDAIARLQTPPEPDLILCDVMMPDLDGIAVYQHVHASAPSLAERFVFMSGGAFTPRARSFLATCGNPRVDKPFDVEEILALADRRRAAAE